MAIYFWKRLVKIWLNKNKIRGKIQSRRTLTNITPRLFTIGSYSMWPKITFVILIAFLIEFPGNAENSIRIIARGYNIGHPSLVASDSKWKSPLILLCRFHVRHVHLLFNRVAFIALLLRHQLLTKTENSTYNSVIILTRFHLYSLWMCVPICKTRIFYSFIRLFHLLRIFLSNIELLVLSNFESSPKYQSSIMLISLDNWKSS